MGIFTTQALNILAVAGISAMLVAAGARAPQDNAQAGIDPITTASTAGHQGNRFVVIDHITDRRCIFRLHRAEGYDVHRVEPGQGCDEMGAPFASARAWQETGRATVTVTDHRGTVLMQLAPGDGFAWEAIEPQYLRISLAAY